MASIRATAARIARPSWSTLAVTAARRMEGIGGSRAAKPRYFGDSIRSGRVLGEEERAAENVYIQKMEREKLRRKADKEKADAAKKAAAAKGDKKDEGPRPS